MAAMAHAFKKYQEMIEIATIRALISLDVFDALPIGECESMSLQVLANTTATNTALLQRLLRVVVSTGLIAFNPSDETYAHTEISLGYRSGQSSSDFFKLMHDEILKPSVMLPEWIKHRGRLTDPAGPDSHTHNPSTFHDGKEGNTLFDQLSADPERLRTFHAGMSSMAAHHPFTGFYDISHLTTKTTTTDPTRPLIVDVGGGNGTFFARLLEADKTLNPSSLILQDVHSVIEVARKTPDLPANITYHAHDFHTPQPVLGASIYHIRACLHDYGDAVAVNILSHIARAMAPDSKLLIGENIMSQYPEAGEAIALSDMTMMIVGGRVRTEGDWKDVLGQAGLVINNISRAPGLTWALIEAELMR